MPGNGNGENIDHHQMGDARGHGNVFVGVFFDIDEDRQVGSLTQRRVLRCQCDDLSAGAGL